MKSKAEKAAIAKIKKLINKKTIFKLFPIFKMDYKKVLDVTFDSSEIWEGHLEFEVTLLNKDGEEEYIAIYFYLWEGGEDLTFNCGIKELGTFDMTCYFDNFKDLKNTAIIQKLLVIILELVLTHKPIVISDTKRNNEIFKFIEKKVHKMYYADSKHQNDKLDIVRLAFLPKNYKFKK